jgi:hypothetical protein
MNELRRWYLGLLGWLAVTGVLERLALSLAPRWAHLALGMRVAECMLARLFPCWLVCRRGSRRSRRRSGSEPGGTSIVWGMISGAQWCSLVLVSH